jgi:hypothetical protein
MSNLTGSTTKLPYEDEEKLRKSALTSVEAAIVLADYYEEHGQPSRARMWRQAKGLLPGVPSGCSLGIPDLHITRSPTSKQDPRRNAMIWLLHHVASRRSLAKMFGVSLTRIVQIIADAEKRVRSNAIHEARSPTLAATARLRSAGALNDLGYCYRDSNVPPPEGWPRTRPHEKRT